MLENPKFLELWSELIELGTLQKKWDIEDGTYFKELELVEEEPAVDMIPQEDKVETRFEDIDTSTKQADSPICEQNIDTSARWVNSPVEENICEKLKDLSLW